MFFRRFCVPAGVYAALAVAVFIFSKRIQAPPVPLLPAGKVEPFLTLDMMLAPDGTLWKLEHSSTGLPRTMSITPLAPGAKWRTASGTGFEGLGVKDDGTLWHWRSSFSPAAHAPKTTPPTQIGTSRDWVHADYSFNYAPLIKMDGTAWFLGAPATDPKRGFPPLHKMLPLSLGADRDWAAVERSDGTTYGLKQDGSLWHWNKMSSTPVRLGTDTDWSAIADCTGALAALKRDGTLWIRGRNAYLVAAGSAGRHTPDFVRVGNENCWTAIVGGSANLLAKHTDGSWWASGLNVRTQLGISNHAGADRIPLPTRMPIDHEVWAWSVGHQTTLFLTRSGTFYYMGLPPRTPRAQTINEARLEAVKASLNRTAKSAGVAAPFGDPQSSMRPVEIGELPESVISALKSTP